MEVHVFTTNTYEGTPTESEGKKIKRIYLITGAAVAVHLIICNPVSTSVLESQGNNFTDYSFDELIFHVWSQTSAPILKGM